MTSQQLPERPNLEQLKKQAKTLLHAAQNQEPSALARFQVLPAFARITPTEMAGRRLGLHDAQSVLAREHGFDSWRALREAVEERNLTFAAAVEQFVRFAVGGAAVRARRLQALHPGISRAGLHTALVLGDTPQVEARLRDDAALAKQSGGPENWEPLQYVCQSSLSGDAPEAGANPTEGVSLQILASGESLAPLDLLLTFGAKVNGLPGGVPPLRYVLGYARKSTGIRWLLERGASPHDLDGMFAAPPLIWTVEGARHPSPKADHLAVVRLLVDAGSAEWAPPSDAPQVEGTLERLAELRQAAGRP